MEPLFTVFGLPVTRFAAGVALSALVVCVLALPRVLKKGAGYGAWVRLSVCVLFCGWAVSRVVHQAACLLPEVIINHFMDLETEFSWTDALAFWRGGYSLMGAVYGVYLGAILAERWTRAERGTLRDALALSLPAGILVLRLAMRGSDTGLGRTVRADWLVNTGLCPLVDGDPVHPVYLYQAAAALVLLIVMAVLVFKKNKRPAGDTARIFLVVFGVTSVVLESLRADGHMVVHFVHMEQVLAILMAAAVMLGWSIRAARKPGRHPALAVGWVITLACVGAAVAAEFGVDRWGKPLLAYGVMAVCMAVVFAVAMEFRHMAER